MKAEGRIEGGGLSLLDWLIKRYPLAKRQTFKQMLTSGRVSINGKPPRSLRALIESDDRVVVLDRISGKGLQRPRNLPFNIVFEDRDVLVIDKPSGLLTSTVASERRPTAWAAVQEYLADNEPAARPGLIHRLDRDASGLLVFSKNDTAYRHLKQQFLHHTVSRIYIAQVHGILTPPGGRLESYLVERADGVVRSTKLRGKGQIAVTDYETIASAARRSVLRLTLQTGRKHQIRSQLAEKGTPIINDPVYGEGQCTGPLILAAVELSFDHPRTGTRVRFVAKRDELEKLPESEQA
jgi:23S rRNA pseudouridine1911/1915/1917 synthase